MQGMQGMQSMQGRLWFYKEGKGLTFPRSEVVVALGMWEG